MDTVHPLDAEVGQRLQGSITAAKNDRPAQAAHYRVDPVADSPKKLINRRAQRVHLERNRCSAPDRFSDVVESHLPVNLSVRLSVRDSFTVGSLWATYRQDDVKSHPE